MEDTYVSDPSSVGVAALKPRALLAGGSSFVFLMAAGAAHGGYFPGAFGWLTLAAAWAVALALLLDTGAGVSRGGLAFLALLAGYAVWSLLSSLWSIDPTSSLLEAQRNLVYVAGAAAALLLGRESPRALILGSWAAIAALCTYALLTRLVPDRFGVVDQISGYRLSEPIGYWNALALLAAVGALLGAGFAARSVRLPLRVAAATSVPLFAATMYFTFSRGGWASLIVAVGALAALDPRRLQALWWVALLAAASALAVVVAAYENALSTAGTPLTAQAHAGHRAGVYLLLVLGATAAATAAWAALERRVPFGAHAVERRGRRALAAAVVAGGFLTFLAAGAPWTLAERAWHGFAGGAPAGGPNLSGRLFHLSGSGRVTQWKIAWREAEAHPLAGSGAATWERYWNRDRPGPGKVRNVHNLYLEALATLGAVGAALLIAALFAPLAAGIVRRADGLVPFVVAAFVAYLVHAIVDWDWQLTGVTLPVLAAVATLFAGGASRFRPALYAAAGVLAAVGLWGIAAQTALANVHDAASARRASDLQPWSTEPWRRLAEHEITAHHYADARHAIGTALAMDRGDWTLWLDLARASDGSTRLVALAHATALNPYSPEVAQLRAALLSLSRLRAP